MAHQFLQLALDTDPAYSLARLSDQMIGSSIVAGWNMNKNTAYGALPFEMLGKGRSPLVRISVNSSVSAETR